MRAKRPGVWAAGCLVAAGLAMSAGASAAAAEDFHGFDPATYNGVMLSPDQLKAMVADAEKVSPPKEGSGYVFGFANLERDISFGVLTERGIKANATAAGIDLLVADNRLDGPTAFANAQSFVRRHVDYAIEFQTDVNFGPVVMHAFNQAGIKVIAIDIPMPGALFFGVNNPRSGFMTGSYLAEAAKSEFGPKVTDGYFVDGILPQSGVIPLMRTNGQVAGFKAVLPNFPADHIISFDTKNTLEESYSQMSNVLGRIPPGVPIMVTGINDQAVIGMVRATRAAHRADQLVAVGSGADELAALVTDDKIVASTGSFPERYGNYIIPMALMQLAGKPVPPAVFVHHVMVTKANVCTFNPQYPCKGKPVIDYVFPQAAFNAYLTQLQQDPSLKGYAELIPKD
jgi:ribose transport system substrate-binding protein